MFDMDEDAFVEEALRMQRREDLGSDHQTPTQSLLNTPMVRRRLEEIMYSPGPYFQSRAPAMGSLDSDQNVPRVCSWCTFLFIACILYSKGKKAINNHF